MDKRQMIGYVVAVLETLAETEGGIPGKGSMIASHVYIALGMDLHVFNCLVGTMQSQGWVTYTGEVITITEKGREMVAEIAKAKG